MTDWDGPNLWSGCQMLAFSGLDGPTQWANPYEAELLPDRLGLRFEHVGGLTLVLRLCTGRGLCEGLPGAAADAFAAWEDLRVGSGGLVARLTTAEPVAHFEAAIAFEAQDLLRAVVRYDGPAAPDAVPTLLVELSADGCRRVDAKGLILGEEQARLLFEPAADLRVVAPEQVAAAVRGQIGGSRQYVGQPKPQAALYSVGLRPGEAVQMALTLGHEQAAPSPLEAREVAALSAVSAAGGEAPPGISASLRRARAKAIDILRLNALAPEGNLKQHWMSSQRGRQRHYNTFHAPFLALGALTFEPALAVELLKAALGQQQANALVPEQAWPEGCSLVTGPPLLCWGFWHVHQATRAEGLLSESVSRLKDYVKFPLASRMLSRFGHARSQGAKFLTWGRGEGSNMDNSPRFDINEPFAAVDFTSYCVSEIDMISRIIEEVTPEHREAVHLGWMGEELGRETREYFWDAAAGFYYDRYPDDDRVDVRSVAGLVPLFAGVASDEQAAELVQRHLRDPAGFWTAAPLASLAADDPRYDQNMWRGAMFPAMNLLLFLGLRRYGFDDEAAELRDRTLEAVGGWYERTGTLWEFYDSGGQRSPADLARGRRRGALANHAWSAAAFLCLLHECPDGYA